MAEKQATPTTLTALIVDDEKLAREELSFLLRSFPQIEVVGTAANGVEAIQEIENLTPDLVFMDVQMPGLDGLSAVRKMIEEGMDLPHFIFATAYDQYAIEAFELAAADYLLKPVRAERLVATLARARRRRAPADAPPPLAAEGERRHFSTSERGRILLVPIADVLCLKAEQKYVTARTAARDYLLDESLVQIEQEFPRRFLRIHRNCLVAAAAVRGVERSGEAEGEARWEILLAGLAERLPVSRRQWPLLRQALGL